jgi:hypothetical protein
VASARWYHGEISRTEAEQRLLLAPLTQRHTSGKAWTAANAEGLFLVRHKSADGLFVLSVRAGGPVGGWRPNFLGQPWIEHHLLQECTSASGGDHGKDSDGAIRRWVAPKC